MKKRILSAIVMLAILIPIILLGGYIYAIAAIILGILSYKEILDLKKSHKKIPKVIELLGLLAVIYLIIGNYNNYAINYRMVLIPLILLLVPLIFYKKENYNSETAFYLLGFIYLIGLGFNLLVIVRRIDLGLLLYLMSISLFTDTFAYAIGCLIGKHKMCPTISPAKSWEGAVSGLIGGTIISVLVYLAFFNTFSIKLVIVTVLLSISGQVGDLIFSKIKRENEIKDFSNIIPGHGGILDRFDNNLIVVIMYAILIFTL